METLTTVISTKIEFHKIFESRKHLILCTQRISMTCNAIPQKSTYIYNGTEYIYIYVYYIYIYIYNFHNQNTHNITAE